MGNQVAVAPKGSPSAQSAPSPIMSFVPMLVVIGILYLLIIRPQQKQAKDHKRLVESLKSGDHVVTQGGIHGTVMSVKGPIVQVKIAENVRVDVNRSAITQVLNPINGTVAPAAGE